MQVFLPPMGDSKGSTRSVKERRTPWMTAIGVLDIVIGTFGALLNGLLLYAAADVHIAMRTIDSSLQSTSERQFFADEAMQLATRAEAEFSEASGFILTDLSFNIVLTLSLVVIGIATLRLARWARWGSIGWSLACIIWLVFISLVEPVDFDEFGLLIMLYPLTLLYLFTRREWKATFGS
jgi:hypothetical protein